MVTMKNSCQTCGTSKESAMGAFEALMMLVAGTLASGGILKKEDRKGRALELELRLFGHDYTTSFTGATDEEMRPLFKAALTFSSIYALEAATGQNPDLFRIAHLAILSVCNVRDEEMEALCALPQPERMKFLEARLADPAAPIPFVSTLFDPDVPSA